MLSNTLNTNEIKNAAGAEIEFQHQQQTDRARVFAQINESPALPHRLSIQHQETGNGIKKRRRSVVRFDKTIVSTVDLATPITISAYAVVDFPVGAVVADTEFANVVAELISFLSTTGAGTTVLFDGTGNGSTALIKGSL